MKDKRFRFSKLAKTQFKYLGPKGMVTAYQVMAILKDWPRYERTIGIVYKTKEGFWNCAALFSLVSQSYRTGAQYEYLPFSGNTRDEAAVWLYAKMVK